MLSVIHRAILTFSRGTSQCFLSGELRGDVKEIRKRDKLDSCSPIMIFTWKVK
jgi:hypothetical protein